MKNDPIRKMDRLSKIVFGLMLVGVGSAIGAIQVTMLNKQLAVLAPDDPIRATYMANPGRVFMGGGLLFSLPKWAAWIWGFSMLWSARKSDEFYKMEERVVATMNVPLSPEQHPVGTVIADVNDDGDIRQRGVITKYEDGKVYVEFPDETEWWFTEWNKRFLPAAMLGEKTSAPASQATPRTERDVSMMSEPELSQLLSEFKITDKMPDGIWDCLFKAWTQVDGDDPITSEQRAKLEQACRTLAAELREQGHEAAHYVDGMQFEKVAGEYAVVSFERNPLAHALFVDTDFRHLAQDLWERGGGSGYRLWFTLRL